MKRRTSFMAMAITLGAVSLGVSSKAVAQQAPADGLALNALEGVSSWTEASNGDLLITMESGEVVTVAAKDFFVIDGQYFLTEAGFLAGDFSLADTALGFLDTAEGQLLLGAVGAGGIIALASGGKADATPPPVSPVNAAPVFSSAATTAIPENQGLAYTAVATDSDGDALTYSLSGPDAALFSINSSTGQVTFDDLPDFESPRDAGGDNVYDVVVTASDGVNSTDQAVIITVTNENDNAPVFASNAGVSVSENQTAAYAATANDADDDVISYSLSGVDAALFAIDAANGVVSFITAPDFEAPADANGDNIYDVVITASDGTNSTDQAVAISVTNQNDNAPVFSSDAAVSVSENQTAAYMAEASDADGDAVTYSLSGSDAALFDIDAATGEVTFRTAPDFEAPTDANGDNQYDIVVTASDGTNSTDQAVAISVTNENDNYPIFNSPAAVSVAENQTAAYMVQASDADGDTVTYSLSGTDAALFSIDAATGAVSFLAAPDFEAPGDADGDNVYDVLVTASDGVNATDQAVVIAVTNQNDNAPVFVSDAAVSVSENQTAAYMANAGDADGDTVTYSLSGGDAALFAIDPASGLVSFNAAPDFETPGDANGDNIYDIVITASDGVNATDQAVAITVTNENDNAPVFSSDAAVSVSENQTAAYAAVASDADGDTVTYSLSGTDAALFSIDAASGVVSFLAAPDFESPRDAGGDNVYDVVVTASDGVNSTDQAVTINVTNENDNAPVFTSAASASVAENQTTAYSALASDADGDAVSYALSGSDAALFSIDAASGAVRFNTAPDFEAPTDANGDNIYDLVVTASDGTNSTDQAVAISVTDENDHAPVFSSDAAVSVSENQTAAYAAVASDADGDTVTYSLSGTDAALFSINAASGAVGFNTAPDFEAPTDAGGDNVYDVVVTASDGVNATDQAVAISVTNVVAETPPVIDLTFLSASQGFIVQGDIASDYLGTSVSNIGDINGDGFDDIILGATGGDDGGTRAGEAYVIFGSGDGFGTQVGSRRVIDTTNLDPSEGFILVRASAFGFAGSSVAGAGDINGDGFDDFIVSNLRLGSNNIAERSYVIFGTDEGFGSVDATGRSVVDLINLNAADGFILTNTRDTFTYSRTNITTAGDINGDGFDDIVGLIQNNEGFVLFGGPEPFGTVDANGRQLFNTTQRLDPADGFRILASSSISLGTSVSTAGDINGDGYDDIVLTAPRADPLGRTDAGQVTVIFGGPGVPGSLDGTGQRIVDVDTLPSNQGFTIIGVEAGDQLGDSVRNAGDFNGDGFDDIIISTRSANSAPNELVEAYIIFGRATGFGTDSGGMSMIDLATLRADQGFVLSGKIGNTSNTFSQGLTVSSAGDVNGDGHDDLLIGASRNDLAGTDAGLTYVLFGRPGAPGSLDANGRLVLDESNLNGDEGFVILGDRSGDRAGSAVSSAGDINGDGFDDLIVGAEGGDDGGNGAGEAYIIFGGQFNVDSTGRTVVGTSGPDILIGDAGDNSIFGSGGADVIRGGAGDDTIFVSVLDFADIDGGTGNDTLRLSGSGQTLDLDAILPAEIKSIETIDLTGSGNNVLRLDQLAVFDLTEERANGKVTLFVNGNTGDRVEFTDAGWFAAGVPTINGRTYTIFRNGDADVLVQGAVVTTVPQAPVFTSGTTLTAAENQTAAYLAQATDGDSPTVTYSISGTNSALFAIDAASGVVSFNAAPDFEAPGDANGDNIYDIVVTASDGRNATDRAVAISVINENDNSPSFTSAASASVLENQTAAYSAAAPDPDGDSITYSLSGTDAALFAIDAASGVVSFIAAPDFETPGDANGDNIYDIVVTASDGVNATDQAVAITVTDENPETAVVDLAGLNAAQGFVVQGDVAGDALAISVSSAGDVNGDGFDDIIIGAWLGDDGGSNAGEAYVLFGKAGGFGTVDLTGLSAADGFIIQGDAAEDRAGRSVSSAGDVNGDGYADLIIGAPYADGGGTNAGAAYVIFGKAGGFGRVDLTGLSAADGFAILGDADGDNAGWSVSSAGDVNGDGFDDVIVGARRGDDGGTNAGEAYVIFGKASGFGTIDLAGLSAADGFVIQGDAAFDFAGTSVFSAGDVNGDGYDDLIVGAPGGDDGGSNAGEAYVIFGKAGGFGSRIDLTNLSPANGFVIQGDLPGDDAGISVSAAGDLNGDGFDDLIIGADYSDNGGTNAGVAYVLFGKAGGFGTIDLTALSAADGFVIQGDTANDLAGRSVSGAGDVNGDGYADLIIGAAGGDDGGNAAGEAYVIFGKAGGFGTIDLSGLTSEQGFIIRGATDNDLAGDAVSAAGDIDGDGYDDLLVGAPGGDLGGTNAGQAYVIFGGPFAAGNADRTIAGAGGADLLIGSDGDDVLIGNGGADVIRGGAGSDRISVADLAFADIDGGTGRDTLALTGSGQTLDLTSGSGLGLPAEITSIEVIDLTGSGSNTLVIDRLAVFDTSDDTSGGVTTLTVRRDGGDSVIFSDAGWTPGTDVTVDGVVFETYDNGNARLLVEQIATTTDPFVPAIVVDLTTLGAGQGFIVRGDANGDFSGNSVSRAGDVNNDGHEDILIGASDGDDGGFGAGEAYVVFGGTGGFGTADGTGRQVIDLTTLGTAQGFIIQGDAPGDGAGFSVSNAGDVNGDGFDDLIVGARNGGDGGQLAGEAYVVFGRTDGARQVVDLTTLGSTQGFIIQGDAAFDLVGTSVSNAGDINGDGYDDLIVGASGGFDGGPAAGEAYVIFGGAGGFGTADGSGRQVIDLTSLNMTQGFIIQGDASYDGAAVSVSGAGDVNGDGYDDLIIGAAGGDDGGANAGEAYVIFGGAGGFGAADGSGRQVIDLTTLGAAQGFIIRGDAAGDQAGRSVSAAGDVNGDGYDDIIVGAAGGDDGGSDAGEAYVIFGGAGGFGAVDGSGRQVIDLTTLGAAQGFIIQGDAAGDQAGRSVSAAGDINGDGYDDIIVGARYGDDGGNLAGEAYVIFGSGGGFGIADGTGRQVIDLSMLSAAQGFVIQGDDDFDIAGSAVSSAGDVDGDGYDDLIVGAPGNDRGGTLAGETYVVFGAAFAAGDADRTIVGTSGGDRLIGSDGDDVLIGNGGTDVFRGGAGDDVIAVSDLTFADIDGGTGIDRLALSGSSQAIDFTLTLPAEIQSVEIIDLTSPGSQGVVLDRLAVIDLSDSRDSVFGAVLIVDGDVEDAILFADAGWTLTGTSAATSANPQQYDIYQNGNATVLIDPDVNVATSAPATISNFVAPSSFISLSADEVIDLNADSGFGPETDTIRTMLYEISENELGSIGVLDGPEEIPPMDVMEIQTVELSAAMMQIDAITLFADNLG